MAVDDRANADTGKVAQQLVNAGVVAVIGHLNSGVSIAAAPIYAERISPRWRFPPIPNSRRWAPTTFRLVANDNLQAKAIGSNFSSSHFHPHAMRCSTMAPVWQGPRGRRFGGAEKSQSKEIVRQRSFDDKTKEFTNWQPSSRPRRPR